MAQRQHAGSMLPECVDKFAELEKVVNTMVPTIKRLDNEFFNHVGGDGLKTIVLKHIAKVESRAVTEKEFHEKRDAEIKDALAAAAAAQEKRDDDAAASQARRLNIIGVIAAIIALYLALPSALVAWKQVNSGHTNLNEILSESSQPTVNRDLE